MDDIFYNQSYSEADRNAESEDDAVFENFGKKVASDLNMGNFSAIIIGYGYMSRNPGILNSNLFGSDMMLVMVLSTVTCEQFPRHHHWLWLDIAKTAFWVPLAKNCVMVVVFTLQKYHNLTMSLC